MHDLVEGAAKGRGGLQPSNYNMYMIFTIMYTAAVFLISTYAITWYRTAVSESYIGEMLWRKPQSVYEWIGQKI